MASAVRLTRFPPIDLSMGSIDRWDNAVAETFFFSLTKELLRRERLLVHRMLLQPHAAGTPASARSHRSSTTRSPPSSTPFRNS